MQKDLLLLLKYNETYIKAKSLPEKEDFFVGLLGLEPRLFWTKTRRVASYTMGQFHNVGANLIQTLGCTNKLVKKSTLLFLKISLDIFR